MKKAIVLFCVLSLLVAPASTYAADEGAAKPVQFLTPSDYVDATNRIKEPASFDWSTGKGRKDWAIRWAVDDNYLKKSTGMIFRGFSNAAFGWVEILTHPFRWSTNAPLGSGYVTGLIMGPIVATLRTASGVIDLGTFWIPWWHGIPMPKPVLGLHDVHHYGTIEDVGDYDHKTKRYFFNWLNEDY
ncbi:MAG: hypothetical protein A3G87_04480 [Omnitrophica bacterium RIFCSPLOWO2_12_FULL_50_11]|nr:MAG: hypothetical protein A3G87_04480 [Omnitrophica bacterium RIFCSPLOWO2_12_FULL_50_11]